MTKKKASKLISTSLGKLSFQVLAMTNIRPKETGLPMTIWVQPRTGKERHGPRIKVQNHHGDKATPGEWASVTIEHNPKIKSGTLSPSDFKLVKKFILNNLEELLKLWSDEISPHEFTMHIKKISHD